MEIYKKLLQLQVELKAPKNLYNSFGKYKYRNAEGILEAVKPFLKKYGLAVMITDEIVAVEGRVYVKATVTVIDIETGDHISASAMARESEEKKGMDASQVTGTASSYARKYALNGIFLLDDTKDADTDEYHQQTSGKPAETEQGKAIEDAKVRAEIMRLCTNYNINAEKIASKYGHKALSELTPEENVKCLEYITSHLPKGARA